MIFDFLLRHVDERNKVDVSGVKLVVSGKNFLRAPREKYLKLHLLCNITTTHLNDLILYFLKDLDEFYKSMSSLFCQDIWFST